MSIEKKLCGICFAEVDETFPTVCDEKPELLNGPFGMYHCLDCGTMLVAKMKHPEICDFCLNALKKTKK